MTAFLPYIGYEGAQALLADYRALNGDRAPSGPREAMTVRAYLEERLGKDLVDRVLSADALSALGFPETVRPSKGTNP